MEKKNLMIFGIVGVVILAVLGIFYLGGGDLNLISSNENTIELLYSCNVPIDCEDAIIENDAGTREDIKFVKQTFDINCEQNKCIARTK